MKLKINDVATFRAYNGLLVTGRVTSIGPHCYLVKGDTEFCTMFSDGLFRFTDYHLVAVHKKLDIKFKGYNDGST